MPKGGSHTEGISTTADGRAGHAEGSGSAASGSFAHAEGYQTTASLDAAHAEGYQSAASGYYSHAEGTATAASGQAAHSEGNETVASGRTSHAQGSRAVASRYCQDTQGSGYFAAAGDAQTSVMVLRVATANATPATMTADGGAVSVSGGDTNVVTIGLNRVMALRAVVVARRSDNPATPESAAWFIEALVERGSSGNAVLVNSTVSAMASTSGASAAWAAALSIDTTSHYAKLTVTGEASRSIRWVARVEFTEVG